MTQRPMQAELVSVASRDNSLADMKIALLNSDGSERVVPEMGVAVADLAALTATAAAGATPTDAEFDALLADVTAIHTKVNALLDALRDANVIDTA